MKLIRRREYRTVKLSPKAHNVAIQLQYDELTCYMFASILQAGAISSHVHDFPDTFCVRYYGSSILPSPYYELLMKKGVTRTKVHLRAALKYCTLSCNCTKLVNSEHHAASGSIVRTGCMPSSLLLLQPQSVRVGMNQC